jgi:hypothetical protein
VNWSPSSRATFLLALALAACSRLHDPLPTFPRVILWAWERPEQVDFVDSSVAGIAFLSRTIAWAGGKMRAQPRLQPLRVRPGAHLMAVIRLEPHGVPPEPRMVTDEILRDAALPGIEAVQIDFDARVSERQWYTSLLRQVRARLKPGMPLSITALASWCEGDPWIRNLPVDGAVPMLFRMGAGEWWDGREFRVPICRSSVGISTDELPTSLPRGRRLFVFNPRSWTKETYLGAVELARKWR